MEKSLAVREKGFGVTRNVGDVGSIGRFVAEEASANYALRKSGFAVRRGL